MYLWVYETNTNARKFYERVGATLFETSQKQHEGGTISLACRYVWEDVPAII
jgi:hypothetical protein